MRLDITKALELYGKADNLAKDWLIKSWSLKNEDYEISRLYYRKACKERTELARRLNELCQNND